MRERSFGRKLAMLAVTALSMFGSLSGIADAEFGFSSLSTSVSTSQAGAHADFSASLALETEALGNPAGDLKDMKITLPPGLTGDPQVIERCSNKSFVQSKCSSGAQIGVLWGSFIVCRGASTRLTAPAEVGDTTITVANTAQFCAGEPENTITIGSGAGAETVKIAYVEDANTLALATPLEHSHPSGEDVSHIATTDTIPIPLFNLEPTPGHVATFGAELLVAGIIIQVDADSGGRLTATIEDSSTLLPMQASELTLWGVPADPSHNSLRCNQFGFECGPTTITPVPFMTNPTSCDGSAPQTEVSATSWEGQTASQVASLPATTGCAELKMSPTLTVTPGTTQRDEPAQYEIDLKSPQDLEAYGVSTAAIRDVSITLPSGTSLSPALANGLQVCSASQAGEDSCPNAAKIGTAEIDSPLLSDHLEGGVYIGAPTPSEPYPLIVLVDADSVHLALHGQVTPAAGNGQLTATFDDVPQLPFSDFRLKLFGGPSAALANPLACGAANSTSQIGSYAGTSADPSSAFTVDANGEGGACPPSPPFTPSFEAGTTNPTAGGFSPFTLSISREDGQQAISSFTTQLPAGLVGLLTSVPSCEGPQAAQGDCSPASQVGTATIAAGPGSLPLALSGPVYLTGPYEGAPYGLAVVVDASAGPFDLGRMVVRSRILLNPANLRLTIASDPFPQILGGVPLRLRAVSVNLDRPDFVLNPTDCSPQAVTATVEAAEGAQATLATPFAVDGCTGLAFAPRLTASTLAKASLRGDGASLAMSISNPTGSLAAMKSMLIQLPAQLRPRLTTIQHACPDTTGSMALSACPPNALVGHATVISSVTGSPLTGSIYLLAHGGSTLPSLVMQLSGGGISVNLDGALSISRRGVISAAFRDLPDVPINSFHLEFSRGPFSMLGAIQSLCSSRLSMPYEVTGQNGAQIKRTLQVAVEGCPKPKRHRKTSHKRH